MTRILYELSNINGEVIESCATATDISSIIGVSDAYIRDAELKDKVIKKQFRVRRVDYLLRKDSDTGLLLEYDLARENLLNLMRR